MKHIEGKAKISYYPNYITFKIDEVFVIIRSFIFKIRHCKRFYFKQ